MINTRRASRVLVEGWIPFMRHSDDRVLWIDNEGRLATWCGVPGAAIVGINQRVWLVNNCIFASLDV